MLFTPRFLRSAQFSITDLSTTHIPTIDLMHFSRQVKDDLLFKRGICPTEKSICPSARKGDAAQKMQPFGAKETLNQVFRY